jgi:hypothetical protein
VFGRRHLPQPPSGFLCSAAGAVSSGSADFSLASILTRSSGSGLIPPSNGDCHTPLPREVRKDDDTTPRACCPNCAAPAQAGRHAGHRPQRIAAAGRVLAAISCARRDPWALGTRSDEGAVSVVYGGIRPRRRCRALPPITDSARRLGMRCWPWQRNVALRRAFSHWAGPAHTAGHFLCRCQAAPA